MSFFTFSNFIFLYFIFFHFHYKYEFAIFFVFKTVIYYVFDIFLASYRLFLFYGLNAFLFPDFSFTFLASYFNCMFWESWHQNRLKLYLWLQKFNNLMLTCNSWVFGAVFRALEHEWEQDNDSISPWRAYRSFGRINCYRVGCFSQSWQVCEAVEIIWLFPPSRECRGKHD